jgi:hypothetical protein
MGRRGAEEIKKADSYGILSLTLTGCRSRSAPAWCISPSILQRITIAWPNRFGKSALIYWAFGARARSMGRSVDARLIPATQKASMPSAHPIPSQTQRDITMRGGAVTDILGAIDALQDAFLAQDQPM